MEDYRTLRGTGTGEYEEKHSRFIALAAFVDTEEKALAVLEQVRAANRTARHNVYAYCLRKDSRVRYSDDGEPAKTAGLPVLEAIQHAPGISGESCWGQGDWSGPIPAQPRQLWKMRPSLPSEAALPAR